MGAGSSTEQITDEQREVESLAASTGSLPSLQKAFSSLSDPQSNSIPLISLQQCFCFKYRKISCEGEIRLPNGFSKLLDKLDESIAEFLFSHVNGQVNWTEFVKGYVKCCGRMPASTLLNALLRVIVYSAEKAGIPLKLNFDSGDAECKPKGSFSSKELGMIFWVCWVMTWSSRGLSHDQDEEELILPDINHLISSAVVSCAESSDGFDAWDCDLWNLADELSAGKIHIWVVKTVPNLADCFQQFVRFRIQKAADEPRNGIGVSTSSNGDSPVLLASRPDLLMRGQAWAVSLSQRSGVREEILRICFLDNAEVVEDNLLYQSSRDGKGLNRFWSGLEGYCAPLLILISGYSSETNHTSSNNRKWVIGLHTQEGLENKDTFYGYGGNLFAIYPVFQVFPPSGKDKNYVYSHLHPTGRAYDPHPKPVGIAFGGTSGNERIFINEDFSKIIIRHSAVDKTYQSGSLTPNQGFLPVEDAISDVYVWGLGGRRAKEVQLSYKNREDLFTQQRRKIDLKTFSNWEDSPEKMMMDMMSNPNAVRREER
ncbi:hypothetical protein V2J09_018116 [Rumex salicifolius]